MALRQLVIDIETPFTLAPAELWAWLTQPERLAEWAGPGAVLQLEPGGHVSLFDGWVKGEVRQLTPGSLLEHTWEVAEWPPILPKSVVRYAVKPQGAGSVLHVTHRGFPTVAERDSHEKGWHTYLIAPIRAAAGRA
jgi:uncharacterized protein YndB with AHSA1/START domain